VTIAYEDGKPPWIESYLQDFFGTKVTPLAGRVPIVLHLLAPNKRAFRSTTDLRRLLGTPLPRDPKGSS